MINPKDVELHHNHRKLLKYISKHSNSGSQDYIDLTKAPRKISRKLPLRDYVYYLHKQGLIYIYWDFNEKNGNSIAHYELVRIKQNGDEYFKWRWERFRTFLNRSILVPMIVAIITALITNGIVYLIK